MVLARRQARQNARRDRERSTPTARHAPHSRNRPGGRRPRRSRDGPRQGEQADYASWRSGRRQNARDQQASARAMARRNFRRAARRLLGQTGQPLRRGVDGRRKDRQVETPEIEKPYSIFHMKYGIWNMTYEI